MLTSNLIENISMYIKRIGVVPKSQIIKMFSDNEEVGIIEMCLSSLIAESAVRYNEASEKFLRRNSVSEHDFQQELITEAAWILADMGSERVRDFFVSEYPFLLYIIGENNVCYDVTVFTYETLNELKMTVERKRRTLLPPDVEDECIHIALIPDIDMAKEISKLSFDSYCVLARDDKKPEYYDF